MNNPYKTPYSSVSIIDWKQIDKHKSRAKLSGALWLLIFLTYLVMVSIHPLERGVWDARKFVALTMYLFWLVSSATCLWYFAKSKGYSGFIGLALAVIQFPGLIVLFLLPNKYTRLRSETSVDG